MRKASRAMFLALATLCYVMAAHAAAPTTTTTTKLEARLRQFGSGAVVGLKRTSNTANQSSLSGAWGNINTDGDSLPGIGVAGKYETLDVYRDPGDCNSSQLTPTTINDVDDLKDNLNEEHVAVTAVAVTRSMLEIGVSRACGRSSSGEDDDQAGNSNGMGVIVSEPALSAEAGPAGVLGCLAVCLLLLLRTERASRVSEGLHGCKPRGARGVCALRRAACRRLPRTAYHGLARGVCRTALLLMLASWLGGCDAAGTVCSREPAACDGTFGGTDLYLHGRGLGGNVPSQLGRLTALTTLALHGNRLSGSLPSQLGLLTALTTLYLHGNDLGGSLPSQLGRLNPTDGCVLGFSTNHYDCPIPTLSGSCGSGVTCSYRSSPPPPPSPPPEPLGTKLTKPTEDSGSSSSLSGGAIAALVCGGVAVFVLLVLLVLRFRRQSVQLGKMQMELTQPDSRSITTLSNDDEPTIATNTRSTPPPLPPRPHA